MSGIPATAVISAVAGIQSRDRIANIHQCNEVLEMSHGHCSPHSQE
nr:MAG TPA: hypothetical protein [Caudoviricetes sp.]